MAATAAKSQDSPLLRLHGEIRNSIYCLALTTSRHITGDPNVISHNTTLLQTCRQSREEAKAFFWAENVFHLTLALGDTAYMRWLRAIGREKVQLINHLVVSFSEPGEDFFRINQVTCGIDEATGDNQVHAAVWKALLKEPAMAMATSIRFRGVRPQCIIVVGECKKADHQYTEEGGAEYSNAEDHGFARLTRLFFQERVEEQIKRVREETST